MESHFDRLKAEVIDSGLCMACGTCTGVCVSRAIEMDYSQEELMPRLATKCIDCGLCVAYCPGKDIPLRDLDRRFLGRERDYEEEALGIF